MKLLSEYTANQSFGQIKNISGDVKHSSVEKTPKIWPILENIFVEMTKNDLAFGTTIIDRMKFLFDGKKVPKNIVDSSHRTRMLCNAIRHKGHEANDIDFKEAIESIAICISYFSGVSIPLEIESIYNPDVIVIEPIKQNPISTFSNKTSPILTIRQKDLIDNPSARLPVALLLDTSGSMLTEDRIGELNKGIIHFFNSVLEDEITKYSVELSIITFGRIVKKVDFANIEKKVTKFKKNMPIKGDNPKDGTQMGEAVEISVKILNDRKNEYNIAGIEYYQPWIVLMTDGQPTDNITLSSSLTSEMVKANKLSFFPIAIGYGANLAELSRFSPKRQPLRLKGLNFREFFEWLMKSAKNTSLSTPSQETNLPPIGWGTV